METGILQELQDRYGSWTGQALLQPMTTEARIDWPGKGSYMGKIGLFVGPDAARWIWCPTPPGNATLPQDFRIEGIRVTGTLSDGRDFAANKCAPSALSLVWAAGIGSQADVLLRVEDAELALPATTPAFTPGSLEAHWIITNAVFTGEEMVADPIAGPTQQRRTVIRFRSPNRSWVLRILPNFRDPERTALLHGVVKELPTAELVTDIQDVSDVLAAEAEAYAVTRLLSLATGGSVGAGVRRIYQDQHLVQEAFFEWSRFGGVESVTFAAAIANDGMLGWALSQFLNESIGPFLAQDAELYLTHAIGYLEQARTSPVIEARIVLCILALEVLTYRLCLKLGNTQDQLAGTNIQQKLDTVRGRYRMGFIDRRFAEGTRETVRNPLMHSGVIPTLTMPEKVQWADDLYALAFRMLLFLVGYSGQWYDPSNNHQPTPAPTST